MLNYFNCTLIKFVFLLFLLSISILTFSENKRDFEPLDVEKVLADIDTIKAEMDSTFYYVKETFVLLKEGVRILGVKKTIQVIYEACLPILMFICLYFLWLRNRN